MSNCSNEFSTLAQEHIAELKIQHTREINNLRNLLYAAGKTIECARKMRAGRYPERQGFPEFRASLKLYLSALAAFPGEKP